MDEGAYRHSDTCEHDLQRIVGLMKAGKDDEANQLYCQVVALHELKLWETLVFLDMIFERFHTT